MSRDIFDDRHGFADARRAFVTKEKPDLDARPPRHAPAARPPVDEHDHVAASSHG